jgi:hypothetical protein
MISKKLKMAIKTSFLKSYEIAHQAGIHPSVLSKIICGIEKVKPNDKRVIAVGRVLGIDNDDCFESETRKCI